MIPRRGKCIFGLLLIWLIAPALGSANPKTFAYVSRQHVITAEVASEHSFVVNFINLSDFVIVIQPNEFIYRGASGRFYTGQVYEREIKNNKGESQKYSATMLLKGHSFTGLNIVGAFHEQDSIAEMSVRIGAKRYYLQPVEKILFEQLAAKIGELDLSNPSSAAALAEANLSEMGSLKSTDGSSEWDRDWQGLILTDGVNPPKIIERPEIPITAEARKSRTYGKVKLSGTISKNGGLQDLKIVKGLGKGLDQRAMDGVKNSWVFLPATRNGEVLETQIGIDVEFASPDPKP
jgi:TonB family protein